MLPLRIDEKYSHGRKIPETQKNYSKDLTVKIIQDLPVDDQNTLLLHIWEYFCILSERGRRDYKCSRSLSCDNIMGSFEGHFEVIWARFSLF